jgi:two-component system nitrate/nitrite response regulator NarL
VAEYGSLKQALLQTKPQILLLDIALPGLNGLKGVTEVRKVNPLTKIIVLTEPLPDRMELALFKAGVSACCPADIDFQQLTRVIAAVEQGELWIRRTLTPRLLDELGLRSREEEQPRRAAAGRLVRLTQREREIAALVGQGNSNKLIARQLDITERTVKAHLTEIFRKLGIRDRLMLALEVMGSALPVEH